MARQAAAKYVILGWLHIEPMSGYDLRERIASSTGYFWHESFGSIYPALARLESEGLIEPVAGNAGHPSRRVYRTTDAGRAQLRTWLEGPYTRTLARNEFVLKVFFGSLLEPRRLREHVLRYRDEHARARADLAAIELRLAADAERPSSSSRLLTVRLGLRLCDATLAWCDEALGTLGPQ